MALAANGDVLAATDQGINICRISSSKKTVEVIGPKNGLPDYYITAIAPAGNNTFWVGTQEKGVCLYNHTTRQITIPPANNNWSYGQINAILATQNNTWIATEENRLLKLSGINLPLQPAFTSTADKNKISNLLQDNEGNIWMTSATELIAVQEIN